MTGDMWDEYLHMSELTSLNCLDNFYLCVTDLYQQEYLRKPTARDIQRLHETQETRHGFRGLLGSIDCMHWKWKNCSVAWQEDNGFAITSLDEEYLREPENRPVFVRNRNTTRAAREEEIRDKDVHNALRADLTEHIWNLPPNYRCTI
ncbi:uncharacterized protein [Rutidosis leptorrhynchoides]|uniref:uncharacterized protein n=1 Tax=Rutidosis leptorrhynchoides TaxID=125765 RepID=UPI003A9964BD